MSTLHEATRALSDLYTRGPDTPFVDFGSQTKLQLLHVNLDAGFWSVRVRLPPGISLPTHRHTGPVHGLTLAGKWQYQEHTQIYTRGAYLYEPAGSTHTLTTLAAEKDDAIDAWFLVFGANLDLDADGRVAMVLDARFMRDAYFAACEEQGAPRPNVAQ